MAHSTEQSQEVFSWLKSMPLAPEYRPSLEEFQDPIAYIFKIEKEASQYGICKIIPPVPPAPKKTAIGNLNRSLLARAAPNASPDSKPAPTFTTRQQQIGFCPRKPRPVRKPVWQSGENYTLQEFEAKAKSFERNYLKKHCKKAILSALEVETLFWKATVDKPSMVEYANDMPGSAFVPLSLKKSSGRGREAGEGVTVGETPWNMRAVSRAKGSLLRFMKEEIPGVTSPMVYIAMLFSWFAWHVEDHDLHSLNYLHMGAGKTWYGVPREAAVAFEEVVRVEGYGGEFNPLVTFSTLGEKTTVMSPEVFVQAGIPCCRLVQNAGEFVVTFPRAYHSGFSHGFNFGEAANIATPEWLRVATDAAIRRASINYPPMVSHFQLLYDLALELCSRIPMNISAKPKSSRLKDKKKSEGENVVKELFVQDLIQNNKLLHILGKGSAVVPLPKSSFDISLCSDSRVASRLRINPRMPLGLCNYKDVSSNETMLGGNEEIKGKLESIYESYRDSSFSGNDYSYRLPSQTLNKVMERDGVLPDQRLFSCVTCGILCFACVAVLRPTDQAARCLMSADCSFYNDWTAGSGVNHDGFDVAHGDAVTSEQNPCTNRMMNDTKFRTGDWGNQEVEDTVKQGETSALGLLASAYGNSSDSEEDHAEPNAAVCHRAIKINSANVSPERKYKCNDSDLSPDDKLISRRSNGSEDKFGDRSTTSHANPSHSPATHSAEKLRFSKAVTMENADIPFVQRSNEDSSRMHVFCLEHAVEVEQQLRQIGGVHVFLLCHPEYPKIEAEAKLVAEELGIDHSWNDILYGDATKDDEEQIQSALDSEDATPGNGDWAGKLGINLFYSANLSRSTLYSKQMPYNCVIYTAFGRTAPASSPTKSNNVYGRRSSRPRKVVAGKWCGKVWMSNQVHPFLAQRDSEEQEQEQHFHAWAISDENVERKPEIVRKAETAKAVNRKRKKRVETVASKNVKCFEPQGAVSDDSLDAGSLRQLSCDLLEDDSLLRHWNLPRKKRVKFIERDGAESEDAEEDSTDRHRQGKHGNFIKEDEVSRDSLVGSSLKRHKRVPGSWRAKFSDGETVVSDDEEEEEEISHFQHQRILRGKKVKSVSDDSPPADNSLKKYRRMLKDKQRKVLESDDAVSDNDSDDDSRNQLRRILRGSKQVKCMERDDVFSDYSVEDNPKQRHRRAPSSKAAKFSDRRVCRSQQTEREDAVPSDSTDDSSLQRPRRVPRCKQTKILEREDAFSDDLFDLRSGKGKTPAPQKVKQVTPRTVKHRPTKQVVSQRVKPETNSSDEDENKGGPSTRLRKRSQRPLKELEAKPKEKQSGKKQVKNAGYNSAKVRNEEAEYQCDMEGCSMSFDSKQALLMHKRNICPVKGCGKKFFSHKYLVQHRRVHLDDRPLKCPWKGCKMTFKWAWARTEHIRVHTGARPYVCAEKGCGQTFRFVSDFSRHKRKTGHSGKKGRR